MSYCFKCFEDGIDNVARRFPGSPRQEVLLTRLYYHVFKSLNDDINQSLGQHGLNSTTWFALLMLYGSGENAINPSDLSHAMVSSRTNITRLADELVEKGWVERRDCKDDRRRVFLSLTPEGEALVEKVLPLQRAHVRALWQGFAPAELKSLEKLLRKFLHHLES